MQTMRHVITHDPRVLAELKDARVLMEAALVRIAAELRSEAQLSALRDLLARQRAASADPEAFRELDGRFHHAIAEISGNGLLASLCRAVFDWMALFHRDMVHAPGLERLTLDLSGTTFIDSTGIGVVLRLANDAENRGVELAIVPGPPEVQRVFATAGLTEVLPFQR